MPLGCPVCVPLERPRADAGLILFAFESRCALDCESGPARRAEPGRVIKEKRERPSRSQGEIQANKTALGKPYLRTVPTPLLRQGSAYLGRCWYSSVPSFLMNLSQILSY